MTVVTPKEHGDPEQCAWVDSQDAALQDLDPGSPIPVTWRDRAACLDEDPELFFPIGNTNPAFLQIKTAKAVCGRCEVVETCLQWAMESRQDDGVWGGMSADERRSLKRRNARARRSSELRNEPTE
jgi:WhiB family redox-sensing transcriptional regulator